MIWVTIIALICGAISIYFIILEINISSDDYNKRVQSITGINNVKLPFIFIRCWSPVLKDIAITLAVIYIFSFVGVTGMLISLMASAMISANLYFRRKKSVR